MLQDTLPVQKKQLCFSMLAMNSPKIKLIKQFHLYKNQIKYLEIKLTKSTKYTIKKSWIKLKKIIKKGYCVAINQKTFMVKIVTFPILIYKFIAISIKIPPGFYVEIDRLILKLVWKCKGPTIAKIALRGKKQIWWTHTW